MPQVSFDQSGGLGFVQSPHLQRNNLQPFRLHRAFLPWTAIAAFGTPVGSNFRPTPGKRAFLKMHCERHLTINSYSGLWWSFDITIDRATRMPSLVWNVRRDFADWFTLIGGVFGSEPNLLIGGFKDFQGFSYSGGTIDETTTPTTYSRTINQGPSFDTVHCVLSDEYSYDDLVDDLDSLLATSYASATDRQSLVTTKDPLPAQTPEISDPVFNRNWITQNIIPLVGETSSSGLDCAGMTSFGSLLNRWNVCGWPYRNGAFNVYSVSDSDFDSYFQTQFAAYSGEVLRGMEATDLQRRLHAGMRFSGQFPPADTSFSGGVLEKITMQMPFANPVQLRRDYCIPANSFGEGTCENWNGQRIVEHELIQTADLTVWPDGWRDSYCGFRRGESCP